MYLITNNIPLHLEYIVKTIMLISCVKIIGLPYAHEISKILTLNNIDLREDLKAKMKEFESLIHKSVLGKLSIF